MKVAVVIAAYDEAGNIGPLTERLVQTLDSLPEASWKLIYVIEGTDGTVEIARRFARQRTGIEVLYGAQPSGLGRAFRRGFDAVPGDTDFVVTMDADLNHQPEEIPRLLASLRESNADIVVGSRRLQESSEHGTPAWKRALSRMGNRCINILLGMTHRRCQFRVPNLQNGSTAANRIQKSGVCLSAGDPHTRGVSRAEDCRGAHMLYVSILRGV